MTLASLKQRDMEDWVYPHCVWQLQLLHDSTNLLLNWKWSEVTEIEFLVLPEGHGVLSVRLQFDEHQIPLIKLDFRSLLVSKVLHSPLSLG